MQQHDRWDDFLVAEHELIERCMAVLKKCLDDLDGALAAPKQMRRALDFLLEFGDRIHNRKEEEFLFPRMEQKGIPTRGGPIGVMLMEHEAERKLLSSMLAAIPGLMEAPQSEKEKYRSDGYEYLRVRAEHIWKENDVLYAMGRKVFEERDNDELLAAFRKLDLEAYGDRAGKHYRQLVMEVEKGEARQRLVENLSTEQLHGILETLPFELTFVDADDTVAYFNRLDKTKIFPRTRSVIGRKVEKCHPEKSVDMVREIVTGFRNGTRDKAEFWIDFKDDKVLIRYYPVYDDNGRYLGVLEVTQEIGAIQRLEGQKRLLD